MLTAPAQEALATLTAAFSERSELVDAVRTRWRGGSRIAAGEQTADLPEDLRAAADLLAEALPAETQSPADIALLGELFAQPAGDVLFAWCAASTWRRDTHVARLLAIAAHPDGMHRDRVVAVARERVVEGPLVDALACAPLLGNGTNLALPENAEARARLEILIWGAGSGDRPRRSRR